MFPQNVLEWINAGWSVAVHPRETPTGPYTAVIFYPNTPTEPPVMAQDGSPEGALTLLAILTPLPPEPVPD